MVEKCKSLRVAFKLLYNEHIESKSKRLNEHIYLKYPFRIEYYNIMWHLKLYKMCLWALKNYH